MTNKDEGREFKIPHIAGKRKFTIVVDAGEEDDGTGKIYYEECQFSTIELLGLFEWLRVSALSVKPTIKDKEEGKQE